MWDFRHGARGVRLGYQGDGSCGLAPGDLEVTKRTVPLVRLERKDNMDKKVAIKEFLLKNIIKGKKDITYDDSLINSGLVDSFGILELVFFMDNTFGVRVEDYEILDAEADTINKIVALLEEKVDA